MTKNFLLPRPLVQKIAKATNALLILQWAHNDTRSWHWNATDPDRCNATHQLQYWIMIVVKDDETRSDIELRHDARKAVQGSSFVAVQTFRKKEALRKMKNNNGDFAVVYRLGYPLHNIDLKAFPQPGYARKGKKQTVSRSLEAIM